jgi:hypothetical protein|nr:hypothetical protein [Ruminococcus bromii]
MIIRNCWRNEEELKIREVCGEYALDILFELFEDMSVNTIYFNSQKNAETVKHIIEVDDNKPNNATVCEMEEVKHGKWEKSDTIMGTYNRYSVCHFDEFNIDFPYCPRCGTKMNLESEK